MSNFKVPSRHLKLDAALVNLTTVQGALWRLGLPILNAVAAKYRKSARRGMLWRAIRWQLVAMAALVALMCLGPQPRRAAAVGAAAVVLACLFSWLVSAQLRWKSSSYAVYQNLHAVPPHVAAAANQLLLQGVPQERICVEYLNADPILFVEDRQNPRIKRYDLIIW